MIAIICARQGSADWSRASDRAPDAPIPAAVDRARDVVTGGIMPDLDLEAYSDVPLFNTKAAVRETGVPAATLRAWERRYGIPEPDRTASNYRLYSERDIALIRWLREQVESGLTISQAIELFRRLSKGEKTPTVSSGGRRRAAEPEHSLDWSSLRERLLDAFQAFDEQAGELALSEAFAAHPVEDVATRLIEPVMVEVGERWERKELLIPVEHFATAFIERKLLALFNSQPVNFDGPAVLTGCAPQEQHLLGILLVALFLRRQGMRVIYLGASVPLEDLGAVLAALEPAMLILSATLQETAEHLIPIGRTIQAMPEPRPLFGFGGQAFQHSPDLAARVPGIYLEGNALEAASRAVSLLRQQAVRAG